MATQNLERSRHSGSALVLTDAGTIERVQIHASSRSIADFLKTSRCSALLAGSDDAWSDDELLGLAQRLGGASVSARNPQPVRTIVPVERDLAPRNSLSSRHGAGAFPFHTDGAHWCVPPAYLILHCVDAGDIDRPTRLLPLGAWLTRSIEQRLATQPWIVCDGKHAFFSTPITRGPQCVRYDVGCMRPALDGTQDEVELATQRASAVTVGWRPGDVLVISNRRCLHARGAPNGTGQQERVLKRVLVGGRPKWE